MQVSPRCPACGRESAVVFTIFQAADGKALPQPRKVCLACCPKTPGDS